jgi:hypothetical protein
MRFVYLCAFALITPAAMAETMKADPRAFDACKAQSGTFVQIADCLPEAHVAYKTLDAFDALFPPEAQSLKKKCIELNPKDIVGSASCVTNAIDKAVDLKKSLPDGVSLGDPVFDAVANEDLATKLDNAEKKARATFPKVGFWGGGMYHPYKYAAALRAASLLSPIGYNVAEEELSLCSNHYDIRVDFERRLKIADRIGFAACLVRIHDKSRE